MRIALFTETFLPKIDGIVTRLRFTIRELRRGGHDVLLFAPGDGPTEHEGARIVRLRGIPLPLYPELTLGCPRPLIGRCLRSFKPDLIHCVDPAVLGLAGLYYSRALRLPLVVSYHTRIPQYLRYYGVGALEPLAWWMLKLRHGRSELNLCTSTAIASELESRGIRRVRLWPPAVDAELHHPNFKNSEMRAKLSGGRPEEPLLIYVGRASTEKNIEKLRPVLHALPRVRFAIIGDGPHRTQLERCFRGTNTFFAGYLHGRELARAMASADMLVLPSTTETLGLVLLEAMAAGTLVLGANSGGIPSIIEDGVTGILFDPADPPSLLRAVESSLLDSERLRCIRRQARDRAERWSWAASTQRLSEYYQEALSR